MTLDTVLATTAILIGLAGLVRASEDWRARDQYRPGGVMSADIVALQRQWRSGVALRLLLPAMSSTRTVDVCIAARAVIGAALMVVAIPMPALIAPLLLINVCLLVFFLLRCGYGADGADQMLIVVCVGTLLAGTDHPLSQSAGLWLITAQLTLSFLVAGVAKLFGSQWRSGEALRGILTTERYGLPALGALFNRLPALAAAMCWTVIVLEISFPLALLGIPMLTVAYLVAGLLFHAGVATAMGLNNFLFTFAAAYPIAAYCLL